LNDKLRRLLGFYEKTLLPDHVKLLSTVALFRASVTEETILRLARGMFGCRQFEKANDGEMKKVHLVPSAGAAELPKGIACAGGKTSQTRVASAARPLAVS
jgi:hypothetical protein